MPLYEMKKISELYTEKQIKDAIDLLSDLELETDNIGAYSEPIAKLERILHKNINVYKLHTNQCLQIVYK